MPMPWIDHGSILQKVEVPAVARRQTQPFRAGDGGDLRILHRHRPATTPRACQGVGIDGCRRAVEWEAAPFERREHGVGSQPQQVKLATVRL